MFLDSFEMTGPCDIVAAVKDSFAHFALQPCMSHETEAPVRVCVVLYLIRSSLVSLFVSGI